MERSLYSVSYHAVHCLILHLSCLGWWLVLRFETWIFGFPNGKKGIEAAVPEGLCNQPYTLSRFNSFFCFFFQKKGWRSYYCMFGSTYGTLLKSLHCIYLCDVPNSRVCTCLILYVLSMVFSFPKKKRKLEVQCISC